MHPYKGKRSLTHFETLVQVEEYLTEGLWQIYRFSIEVEMLVLPCQHCVFASLVRLH